MKLTTNELGNCLIAISCLYIHQQTKYNEKKNRMQFPSTLPQKMRTCCMYMKYTHREIENIFASMSGIN